MRKEHLLSYCQYGIKKFSDSLKIENHEVQNTQHSMIIYKMSEGVKILKYILYVLFSRSMIMSIVSDLLIK